MLLLINHSMDLRIKILRTGKLHFSSEGYIFPFLVHIKKIFLSLQSICLELSNFDLTKSILLFVFLEFGRKQGPKH